MSKRISFLTSLCSGHGGFPPRPSITGSEDCYVENQGCLREEDQYDTHCNSSCHTGAVATASNSVYINGAGIAREDDEIDCGSLVDESIDNVFSGD